MTPPTRLDDCPGQPEVPTPNNHGIAVKKTEKRRSGQNKTGVPCGNAPTLSSYHIPRSMSIIRCGIVLDSPLYTIHPEVICVIFRLAKTLPAWYPDGTKKVTPNMVMTPVGWTFPIFRFT